MRAAALLVVVVLVAVNAPLRAEPASDAGRAQAAAPAAAPVTPTVTASAGYILGPDDQVLVEVFGEEDLKGGGRLSSEGSVSLPLLGPVRLGGLTTTQAASRVADLLRRDYLVNPRVSVMILGVARRRFTVLGQVNRPGSYEMPEDASARGGIDLLEALAMAGGYTAKADPGRVTVVRHGPNESSDTMKVDAKRLARGQALGQGKSGFIVKSGDSITVAESIW